MYLDISGGLGEAVAGVRMLGPVALVVEVPRLKECLVLGLPDHRCVLSVITSEKGMWLLRLGGVQK